MTKKANIFDQIGQLQGKCEKLTKLMVKSIKRIDNEIYELIDEDVAEYMNDYEISEWITWKMWFQKNHLHIEIRHKQAVNVEDLWTQFNVTVHKSWDVSEWVEVKKFALVEQDIKLAEKLCKIFLSEKDWHKIREQIVKTTNPILYQDLYINEKQ